MCVVLLYLNVQSFFYKKAIKPVRSKTLFLIPYHVIKAIIVTCIIHIILLLNVSLYTFIKGKTHFFDTFALHP